MQYRFAKTVLTGVLVAAFTATAIAADGFLADRHGAKGVKCVMCHVTATGGKLKMVDDGKHEVCVQCHGFYDKVVQLTETKDEQIRTRSTTGICRAPSATRGTRRVLTTAPNAITSSSRCRNPFHISFPCTSLSDARQKRLGSLLFFYAERSSLNAWRGFE